MTKNQDYYNNFLGNEILKLWLFRQTTKPSDESFIHNFIHVIKFNIKLCVKYYIETLR